MFLNEKSPVYVRVHSKKAELFLLKKTDVVKLSSDYPNIWNKMNEKSIFNFEQIRNIIIRKLTNFCNFYGINIKTLFIKRDTKNCLYSCPNYLMPIPDSIEDDTESQDSQSSDNSKNQNSDKMSSESKENLENENNNKKTSVIEEESDEESNINTNIKNNKFSFLNINQNMKFNNNKNNKFLSSFSKQSKKNAYSLTPNNKNSSLENNKDSISNITIISNDDSYFSPFMNKKFLNPLSSTLIDNFNDVSPIPVFRKNKRKKTKSSGYLKNGINKSIRATCSYSSNNSRSYENIRSLKFDSDDVNDEINSNEKFEIIFQEEDDELINKNIKKYLSSKLLENDKQKKQNKFINKFNNLKISSSSNLEIKSSYDNLNVFTNYRYIIDENLRKKTKHFVGLECGFPYSPSTKYDKSLSKRRESKPTKKFLKLLKTKNSLDSSRFSINNYRCLSFYNKSDCVNLSVQPNENIFNKIKNTGTIRKAESFYTEKKGSKYISPLKPATSIKSKNNYSRRTYKKNSISDSSEEIKKKKNRKKNGISSDIYAKKRTKRKMDLISENMQRDRQNLNNPNEFYADLFSNFVVNNRQITRSGISNMPLVKISRYDEEI